MLDRRIPEWLRHAPTPGVRGFAVLSGFEAVARGILISVMPITVYEILQDAQIVSEVYFAVGLLSLVIALLVPWMSRYVPRRYLYSSGCLTYLSGSLLALTGTTAGVIAGLAMLTVATVVTFISINAYLLDYIEKSQIGKVETTKLFYSALGWTLGPGLGVTLKTWWEPAPFLIAAMANEADAYRLPHLTGALTALGARLEPADAAPQLWLKLEASWCPDPDP